MCLTRLPGYSEAFIKSAKKVLGKIEVERPFFKKVLDSQREYAKFWWFPSPKRPTSWGS